jgi:hypothetical protein
MKGLPINLFISSLTTNPAEFPAAKSDWRARGRSEDGMIKICFGLFAWLLCCVSLRAGGYGPDTENLANRALDASIVSLIREAMSAPGAEIEVQNRTEWHIDYFEKESTRWWSVIGFHFKAYSPVAGQTLSGVAMTVFVYNPASNETFIMGPEAAAVAIQRGRELNSIPEARPSPTPEKHAI